MFIKLHGPYENEVTVDSSKITSLTTVQYGPFQKSVTQITLLGGETINVTECQELVKEQIGKTAKR